MNYEVVTHEELLALRSTLNLLERVLEREPLQLFFYGLTANSAVIAKAQDALTEESEVGEGSAPAKLTTIAVAIPLSSDTVYYLVGSGLQLRDETFAYVAGGDGVRTSDFAYTTMSARVTDEDFEEMALADSNSWLDEFMAKHGGGKQTQQPGKKIERTDEATEAPAPDPNNPIDSYLQ